MEKLIKILALCVLVVGLVNADPIWEDANLDTVGTRGNLRGLFHILCFLFSIFALQI